MVSSELQRQLQTLQGKQHLLVERIAHLQQEIVAKQQELETLNLSIQAQRRSAIRAKREALDQICLTPPARNGYEDRQRRATAAIRPLTPVELTLASVKGNVFNVIIAAFNRQASAIKSIDVRQLRQQIWREWEYERRLLQQDIGRMSQELLDERETGPQRSLRNEIAQLQRELPRLEQQAEFFSLDIEALKDRIILAHTRGTP